MRRTVLLALLLSVFVLGGCDMFRKLAGRPTSGEIERRKVEISRRQAEIEAMKVEQKQAADSLALLDSLRSMCSKVKHLEDMGDIYTTDLDARYYIIVGSFRKGSNAEAMIKATTAAGYLPVLISFSNGLSAVGVSPTCRLEDALLSLKAVKKEDFCPSDVWVLVNR